MSCRQQINGVLHPRYGLVQDTHLDIAETLERGELHARTGYGEN